MFCCAALILVLGLCRAVWVFLRGSVRGSEPGFAPPARRPAPGLRSAGERPPRAGPGFADVGQPVRRPDDGPDGGDAVMTLATTVARIHTGAPELTESGPGGR
jgi:hypothetical protein